MTETITLLEAIKELLADAEDCINRWMPGSAYASLVAAMNMMDKLDGTVDVVLLQKLKDERQRIFDLANFGG